MAYAIINEFYRELVNKYDRQFEEICFKILSSFLVNLESVKAKGLVDRAGIDIFTWEQTETIKDAFQCKGFEIGEFGESQCQQCEKSILSFKKNLYKVENYYFIINRHIKDRNLKIRLQEKLDELVRMGKVKNVYLLELQKFIEYVIDNLKIQIEKDINSKSELLYRNFIDSMEQKFYYENVPFDDSSEKTRYNPLESILKKIYQHRTIKNASKAPISEQKYFFVISEFGFGKTSLMFQLFIKLREKKLIPVYVPFSAFNSEGFSNTGSLCENILSIIDPNFNEGFSLIKKIKRRLLQHLFAKDSKFVLLLDGMDEHFFLKDFTGMIHFFQSLIDVTTMPIISMRKEFWDGKQGNLQRALHKKREQNKLILIEWGQEEISTFLNDTKANNKFSTIEKSRIVELENLIVQSNYTKYYGDIPKRPLFLEMIIQDVLKNGIKQRNLVELYDEVLIKKLERDLLGSHISIIIDRGMKSNEDIFELNMIMENVLIEISGLTMKIQDNYVTLENLIPEKKAVIIFRNNNFKENLNIYLHSVLIPSSERTPQDVTLKFAHFSFLEFFFAKYLLVNFETIPDLLNFNYDENIIKFVVDLLNLNKNLNLKKKILSIPNAIKNSDSLILALKSKIIPPSSPLKKS